MIFPSLLTFLIPALLVSGIAMLARKRTAVDVLEDLDQEDSQFGRAGEKELNGMGELAAAGLLTPEEQRAFKRSQHLLLACTIVTLTVPAATARHPLIFIGPAAVLGVALGYLITRYRVAAAKRSHLRRIEFFLPIVMEHLVMAAESGLDIIPAIGALLELDRKQSLSDALPNSNPVLRLFDKVYTMSQAGVSFERALRDAAEESHCSALRHAFVHLGLAQKEGGEIVGPLRELSDATQLYYQESVEEEIAKMPVKATMPLVLTFAGLILFFISSPVVQIMSIAENAHMPGGGFNDHP